MCWPITDVDSKIINISPNNQISLVVAWSLLMASRYDLAVATAQSYSTPIQSNVPKFGNCKHISCTEVLRGWCNDSIQWCFPCVCNYKFRVFSEASLRKWILSFFYITFWTKQILINVSGSLNFCGSRAVTSRYCAARNLRGRSAIFNRTKAE